MAVGLLGRKVGMTQIYDDDGQGRPGDGDPGRSVPRAAGADRGARRLRSGSAGLSRQAPSSCQPQRARSCRQARQQAPEAPRGRRRRGRRQGRLRAASVSFASSAAPSAGIEVGQELEVDVFADVKAVDVIGTSKGRGTAGVMKRHNFAGQRATHGVKKVPPPRRRHRLQRRSRPRAQGPRMAGHYGRRPLHGPQSQGGPGRRREQPAAGPRRGAGPERRLRGDPADEQDRLAANGRVGDIAGQYEPSHGNTAVKTSKRW